MSNLLDLVLIFLAAILTYAFHKPVLAGLRRFEARNAERRAQEARVLIDKYAHYRQTVQFVEEQIEEVAKVTVADERTGEPVSRYLFLGVYFPDRKDAEAARYAAVIEKAREFYLDLDRIYLSKGKAQKPSAAPPALADPSKRAPD